jgi:hypothetical protein
MERARKKKIFWSAQKRKEKKNGEVKLWANYTTCKSLLLLPGRGQSARQSRVFIDHPLHFSSSTILIQIQSTDLQTAHNNEPAYIFGVAL